MTRRWSELEAAFRRLVAREGVRKVAEAIPAGRDTVYRLIKGETKRPTQAIRAGVERLVDGDDKPRED